ncbi:MAG: NAD-dependent epimerase/dehydratase family protein [Rhodobacteraceae bacterium]|nr:NAD-dependent epimerase/dehydratase family protein [Paracoccaceae bacterium]
MKNVFITGSAGFIGFHLAACLLRAGFRVHGFDGITDYYDVRLKRRRHQMLMQSAGFSATEAMLEDREALAHAAQAFAPDVVIHLAAQAGVRYSLSHPAAYISANLVGAFNVIEMARACEVCHLLMASTSSVYGANTALPFAETAKIDTPLTLYAATKAANEAMGHAYAHLWGLPTTMFRFFTVYGPWGRPDMALFKFTDAILAGRPIDVYNHGNMSRDFTYIDDLVEAIRRLIQAIPPAPSDRPPPSAAAEDTLSPVAPFRVVNIGNSDKVQLLDFIETLENELGRKAIRHYMPLQRGDVPATWANTDLLQRLTGYRPQTSYQQGVARFVAWFRDYYGK